MHLIQQILGAVPKSCDTLRIGTGVCDILCGFGSYHLTSDSKGAKTTRPRHISKTLMLTKKTVSNPGDTGNALRGNSYYKKGKYIYNCFFNRFLYVFDCFSKYIYSEKYQL